MDIIRISLRIIPKFKNKADASFTASASLEFHCVAVSRRACNYTALAFIKTAN